ncbi:MAG: cadmium-translocating P-type ATPase [Porphyromonadaceae bacterium]|nr:cadmium-translocating P-type ATPase [Porphyromonadaceae bacterium]
MEKEQKITIACIVSSIVLLLISFFSPLQENIRLILYSIAYLLVGAEIIVKAVRNLFHGELFDENFLMSVATLGAFAIGEYPEAVAVMLFYQIGELFQDIAVERSRASISSLMDIRPDYANVEDEQKELRQVAPETVLPGSVIVVKPGEKIPLDGIVLSGNSSLDTTALTGESRPLEVSAGDTVISGSLNMTSMLRIKSSGTYGESTVSQILELVEHAETGKAKTERFITRFARWYTPIVVILAVLLALVPPLLTGGEWLLWLNRALIFLVISCPCALVVSVPLTFFAGIGGASRRGILIKGSNYLETLARLRTVVFDKTGTLTQGNFSVTRICPENFSKEVILEQAALAEAYSDHPVALSLRQAYAQSIDKKRITEVENLSGEGIRAIVDGQTVYCGNERLMHRIGISVSPCEYTGTIIHISINKVYGGFIVITDTVKPQSAEAIARLRRAGIEEIVMLTGDRQEVAHEVARTIGIEEVHAELLPIDKVHCIQSLQKVKGDNNSIAFVGDGINDAPVLKLSDVGIAMGGIGSSAAIEAADVVLMDDNPEKVAEGITLSRKTLRIARQNIVFAISIKILVLLLGALGIAHMWEAIFADVGVTVLAVLNALRAMRSK